MPNENNNTVQLHISETSPYLEGHAITVISPGMLVKPTVGGFVAHPVAGGFGERMFSVENPYAGGDIYTTYALDDNVMVRVGRSGDVFLAWVTILAPVVEGQVLSSNGDGTLRIEQGGDYAIAVSIDSHAAFAAPAFIRVRTI